MAYSYGGRGKRGGGARDRGSSVQYLDNKQFAYLFEKSPNKASTFMGRGKRGGGARDRGSSVQYLDNKQFAYLFEKSPNKASTFMGNKGKKTNAILSEDTDENPFLSIKNVKSNGSTTSNGSSKSDENTLSPDISPDEMAVKQKKMDKKQFRRHRKSSIQVETTKTQNEQLNAIKKEVEYLTTEVPHFDEIYRESQQQWILQNRNKTDTEAFSLIQALTQWIHNHGNNAVKEYDEFKMSAETEIMNMVGKIEDLTHENTKLNMMNEEHQMEKEELQNELQRQQVMVIKYENDEKIRKEESEVRESNQGRIDALERELAELKEKNKALKEKNERVDKYYKMAQVENDELRNKNYAMEEEVNNLKHTITSANSNIATMKMKHQATLQNLQLEHQNYAQQMQNEQEKLIAAQQEHNKRAQHQMTPTGDDFSSRFDADDADIQGSGITDDNEEDFETMGGIVSLDNEINVYEYEDDEWLDETDSDYDDDKTPEPESPAATPEPEPYNKQVEFESEKTSYYQDIVKKDISTTFKSSKMSFGQEQKKKHVEFAMESQKFSQERVKQEVKEETKEDSPEPMQFESEKMKIEVVGLPKKKSLPLEMSSTQISHTPQMSSPDMSFEDEMTSSSLKQVRKNMEFSSESTGAMGQKNELINKKNIPKPLKKVIYIDRGKKEEDKLIMGGKNFRENLAIFQHLEKTKGGKPKVLDESRAYKLINNWQTKNKDNAKLKHNPLNNITKSTKNVHVTKATVHTLDDSQNRGKQINVLKITKTKAHTLKPRLFGYMNIIRSSFIPRWKMTQQPRYFFVLDGLPSETNTNEKEPDFAKNRKHDFLVPTLFFFQDKDDYDTFASQVKDTPTRDLKFQKLFAKYAKGTFPLNKFAMDISVFKCSQRLNKLMKRDNIKLPIQEINDCGTVNDLTILLCNDKEIHRFSCNDKFNRNKWVKKVNKLVDKRTQRLQSINNGLLGIKSPQQQTGVRKSVGDMSDIDDTMSSGGNTPASMIGSPVPSFNVTDNIITKNSRMSIYKISNIQDADVEADFD